jgi:hypothetical protein
MRALAPHQIRPPSGTARAPLSDEERHFLVRSQAGSSHSGRLEAPRLNFAEKRDQMVRHGLLWFEVRSQASPNRPLKLVQSSIGSRLRGQLGDPTGMIRDCPSANCIVHLINRMKRVRM